MLRSGLWLCTATLCLWLSGCAPTVRAIGYSSVEMSSTAAVAAEPTYAQMVAESGAVGSAPASSAPEDQRAYRRPRDDEPDPPSPRSPARPRAAAVTTGAGSDYCEVVRGRLSAADCRMAERRFNDMVTGNPQAKVPAVMYRGEPAEVSLLIGMPGAGEAEAREAAGAGGGRVITFQAKLGSQMRAELVGAGFAIKLQTPAQPTQEVPPNGAVTWTWEVVPQAVGALQLWLKTAVVVVDEAGKEHVLDGTPKAYPVEVKVHEPPPPKLMERVRKFIDELPGWTKAISTAIAGLGTLYGAVVGFIALFRKIKTKPTP